MGLHYLCNIDDLSEEQGKEFVVGDRIIAVFRTTNSFLAVDGMCAHQGGPIAQGQRDGTCITCPWHGWQYDLRNGANCLTGKRMLETYPTKIQEDQLWIELPE